MHVKLKRLWKHAAAMSVMSALCVLPACSDDYEYDNKAPENLGESIYDCLQSRGNFTYALRLIDDLDYAETLRRTGSKTLFVADDEAFERFFKNNSYGVSRYEDLTPAQKRAIMNTSMINMSYLSEMLSNVAGSNGAITGMALRRYTSCTAIDSVLHVTKSPLFSQSYWNRFSGKGIYLVEDAPMIVHFTPTQMATMGMTAEDFSILNNGIAYENSDIYVNSVRMVERDITCKNGYIHVMAEVLLPAGTMADAITNNEKSSIFSGLLDKFCAPYYSDEYTASVREFYNGSTPLRPALTGVDSVFVKGYFNEFDHTVGPNKEQLSNYGLLYFDPASMKYTTSTTEQDMGTMFVPTDKAMEEFFNGGKGSYLRDAYGTWDNVPTDILAVFLKNHQKRSFKASLPHLWPTLTDESSNPIDIKPSDVDHAELTGNGAVYFVNTVFPPIDYQGVYASVLTADNTNVMKWAITDDWSNLGDLQAMRFYMYLRSMENMYNLLVPTDEAMANYREPISWARGGANREIWNFKYNKTTNNVTAEVYAADENGNAAGSVIRTITDKSIIRNRLRDILDLHIVIGENEEGVLAGYVDETGATYALTKGGGTIRVNGKGNGVSFNGGSDIEMNVADAKVIVNNNGNAARYDSDNGRTFFIDHILQDATTSVYEQLEAHPEFKAFLDLCRGHDLVFNIFSKDEEIEEIFGRKLTTSTSGIGYVVNSFNNFRYTVLVPTEEALEEAFRKDPKLYTWDQIAADSNLDSKREKTLYLLKFIRFHFVDNSAYITGVPYGPASYETGARNEFDKFHRVTIESDGRGMTIRGVDVDSDSNVAHVITAEGNYNIMARDFIVDNADISKAKNITASSRAVIHLIDKALKFE